MTQPSSELTKKMRRTAQLSPIRLGAISFVNTIPIYAGYQPQDGVTLCYNVPARLNAMIRAGELDISPVSSACYLREKEHLILLDDLSVSSPGAVESVIFLSRTPLGPQLLDLAHINIPNDSETSVMLLAYLLQEATGQDLHSYFSIYEATDYRQILQDDGNALVIGDHALMIQDAISCNELTDFYCYDLSTLWKEKTGLPFVFAVWVANRAWAAENTEALQQLNQALCASRNQFFQDATSLEQALALAQSQSSLPRATLERYYHQCLDYTFDEPHRQSLSQFESIINIFSQGKHPAREHQPA